MVATVCAGIVVLSAHIVAILTAPQQHHEQERWLRYEECLAEQQARTAHEDGLLVPEHTCRLAPGR